MTNPQRIYIAGPMTGHPQLNFPAFHAAANQLRADGWRVANPADNGGDDAPYEEYLRRGLRMLLDCQAICLLPGWPTSHGARLEERVARSLKLRVVPLPAQRMAS